MKPLVESLRRIDSPRILVLGDVMLDRYIWGDAERISPEAPVLVLRADRQEVRPGGAASVAALLRALDCRASVAGVAGADADGETLLELLRQAGVGCQALLADSGRPTTSKERFIGRAANRHAHQILRVDRESREPLPVALENRLIDEVQRQLHQTGALLVSDYGKGVCSPRLLAEVIRTANAAGVAVFVDPARGNEHGWYRGATALVPNRTEAAAACGQPIRNPSEALAAAERLSAASGMSVLVKLDREGMVLAERGNAARHFDTRARAVYDVTGAGDMVLAVVGLCRASGISWDDTIQLANTAAGLEVEQFGVAPISRREIEAELLSAVSTGSGKILVADEMAALAEGYRHRGRKVVFTNGCFDLLHAGHVHYLQAAAALGDVLVVALNSDASVRRLKGPERPIIKEQDRGALMAALECVDHVLIFEEDTPHELLRLIRPDVLVKGGDYRVEGVVGREIVEAYGGKVCVTGKIEGASTTQILQRMRGDDNTRR